MFLERLTLQNFQSFGPDPESIRFDERLTVLLGGNATGKTAASQALLRLFSVVADQRAVKLSDFHVPADEVEAPEDRELRIMFGRQQSGRSHLPRSPNDSLAIEKQDRTAPQGAIRRGHRTRRARIRDHEPR
jgi:predicted ATP-dependent endonuclease of OLD family